MSSLLIAPAASTAEADEAFRLACDVFSAQSSAADYPDYKATLWRDDPAYTESNIIIGRTPGGELAGIVRIVPRQLYRTGEALRVAGISSVCVNPALRGRGHSVAIMEHALRHCQRLGYDLGLLIARRAADHYYTQFGFWGVSAYNRVSIAVAGAQASGASAIDFPAANRDWIDCYRRAYIESYAESFGWFERSDLYWSFLLKRLSRLPGVELRSITLRGEPVGYIVKGDGVIYETAFLDALPVDELVAALARHTGVGDGVLQLDLAPEHRLCRMLEKFDRSMRFRECSYGGHMLRVLNVERVADMLEQRAARRLQALGCKALEEGVDGVAIRWDGARCRVTLSEQAGVRPDYRQTCALLGAHSLSDPSARLADAALPFNVSFPDQL